METTQEVQQEQPIQFAYRPDAKITITLEGWQFNQLQMALKPFEGPLATINNIHNFMIQTGISRPVYIKDVDKNGNLRSDFWEAPKEETAPTPKIEIVQS